MQHVGVGAPVLACVALLLITSGSDTFGTQWHKDKATICHIQKTYSVTLDSLLKCTIEVWGKAAS